MVIAKTRIHMICGICGSNKFFNYSIDLKGRCNSYGVEFPGVTIKCDNCSTITGLNEVIKEEFQDKKGK